MVISVCPYAAFRSGREAKVLTGISDMEESREAAGHKRAVNFGNVVARAHRRPKAVFL